MELSRLASVENSRAVARSASTTGWASATTTTGGSSGSEARFSKRCGSDERAAVQSVAAGQKQRRAVQSHAVVEHHGAQRRRAYCEQMSCAEDCMELRDAEIELRKATVRCAELGKRFGWGPVVLDGESEVSN